MANGSTELAVAADPSRGTGTRILTAGAEVERDAYVQPRWYAVYTRANHERRVATQLLERGVENFLPQYESVRKWKDRRVRLQLPLFPGYIFVHLTQQDRLRVLEVPGVAYLVSSAGRPVAIPDEEFPWIRGLLNDGMSAKPHPLLTVGRRVRVKNGPLVGAHGILLRRKGNFRLVISIDLIQRAVAVDMDAENVEALG